MPPDPAPVPYPELRRAFSKSPGYAEQLEAYLPTLRSGNVEPVKLSPPALRPRPLDRSRSGSTLGSALLPSVDECGPAVVFRPVKPDDGVFGSGLFVSRESPVPDEEISPAPDCG